MSKGALREPAFRNALLATCALLLAVASAAAGDPPGAPKFNRIDRLAFNRRAVELNQPLFWRGDTNGNGALDPDELVVTWTYTPLPRAELVNGKNEFTPKFRTIYERMLRLDDAGSLGPAEKKRRDAVRVELSQGRPTLLESDFSTATDAEKALVTHLLGAAATIERLYARQRGTAGLQAKIPPDDAASAAMFFRNQGPFCKATKTEKDPECRALPEPVTPVFGIYPGEIQKDKSFCALLKKQKNAERLTDHFGIVVRGDAQNAFLPMKYSEAYRDDMEAVARELEAASFQLASDEGPLRTYLDAAAKAFRDDDWEQADEAWVAMSGGHSKYYVRVAPDEVYFEPCAWKAGFALTFARINAASLEWQRRIEPLKQRLEDEFARLAGKPYRPRQVRFNLPDFIDIVLTAGDTRPALGGYGGQSLPNWGRVAERGGRTMVVSNPRDPDGLKAWTERMGSLLCRGSMGSVSTDPRFDMIGAVLHEAAHNLGPAREYKVRGRVDQAVFGGPLAVMLEELKADTAAFYFPPELVRRTLITQSEAELVQTWNVGSAFASVARGMYDAEGRPNTYSHLASIELGALQRAGALEWKGTETAGNAADRGCFELHWDKWQAAVAELMTRVLRIKSRGDRLGAERLKKEWVDDDNDWTRVRAVIAERWLRVPMGAVVYSVSGLTPSPVRKRDGAAPRAP